MESAPARSPWCAMSILPDVLCPGLSLVFCGSGAGADRDLPPSADDPADLRRKVEHFAPGMLAFVGKRAAAITLARPVDYGPQPETIGSAAVFVLPSPSGAARRYWDEAPWFRLAAILAT